MCWGVVLNLKMGGYDLVMGTVRYGTNLEHLVSFIEAVPHVSLALFSSRRLA
jgi:hypothetical protein